MRFPFKNMSRLAAVFGVLLLHAPGISAQTPNWKDRQEYDLFLNMSKSADPKARLELLDSWQDKYPASDVAALRLKYYVATLAVLAPTSAGERQVLLDKCRELLKLDAKDINALYQVSLWGPVIGGTSPPLDLVNETEAAARAFLSGAQDAFSPANKPAGISDVDFAKALSFRLSVAHNALAWGAIARKDLPAAEAEYKASLTANPEDGNTAARYAKFLYDQKRYAEALFEYGRAAQYTGPGPALAPATRSQLMDFFKKTYQEFHGGMDGAEQVLTEAKGNALPPANLSITSAADLANKEAEALNARIASDAAFALWYAIRQNLTGERGEVFFDQNLKGTMIPGGAQGVQAFSGTLVSFDPPDRPTRILVGVEDPAKPDALLEFAAPLPAAALEKVKAGGKVEFSGVASMYTKDPYQLTVKETTLVGVQTKAAGKKTMPKRNH